MFKIGFIFRPVRPRMKYICSVYVQMSYTNNIYIYSVVYEVLFKDLFPKNLFGMSLHQLYIHCVKDYNSHSAP